MAFVVGKKSSLKHKEKALIPVNVISLRILRDIDTIFSTSTFKSSHWHPVEVHTLLASLRSSIKQRWDS